jgi:hypothetical protein
MEKEYKIKRTRKERQKLLAMVNKGRNKAAVMRRAHILLKRDEGKTERIISEVLYMHADTVRNTRKCFVEAGLQAALEDNAAPPVEPKLNAQQQAHLVAIACSPPLLDIRVVSGAIGERWCGRGAFA